MRWFLLPLAALAAILTQVGSAAACGALIAPNGAIRLDRASTLVDWHAGVEHYLTSFSFQGDVTGAGWLVPLPAAPDSVVEGGGWTLQRLQRATQPVVISEDVAAAPRQGSATVILQTRVRALDITVLRGDGGSVLEWAAQNGFAVDQETRDHLQRYGRVTPFFMAARYDLQRAEATAQRIGDGAPVLITMHTPRLWVPLEILAGDNIVAADVYLLTDRPARLDEFKFPPFDNQVGDQVPGGPGFTLRYQQPLSTALFHDLSTDRNMNWVRMGTWLTLLSLDAPGPTVNYDLGIGADSVLRLAPFGTPPPSAGDPRPAVAHLPVPGQAGAWIAVLVLAVTGAVLAISSVRRRRAAARR
ncbi:MAG: DUF2330 domain-containing protein [Candidatus Dormibacteria bacterium]